MKIRLLLLGAVHLIACANPGCAGRAEENGTAVATPKPALEAQSPPEAAPDTAGGQQLETPEPEPEPEPEAESEPARLESIDHEGVVREVQQEQFDLDFSNESDDVLHPKGPVVSERALGALHAPARSEAAATSAAVPGMDRERERGDIGEVVSDRGVISETAPPARPTSQTIEGAQLPAGPSQPVPPAGPIGWSAGTTATATARSAFLGEPALSQDISRDRDSDDRELEAAIPAGPLPMYGAVVLHKVQDYEQWRTAFDELMPERKRAGFVAQGVMRGLDDEKLVAVWLSVTDVAQAKAYFGSKQVRARLAQAGMLGRPQVRLSSNVAARMEPGREGLNAALVALRVEDFSRFEAAFRSQADARVAAGVVGFALSQDVTDAHRVYLYLQAENPLSFRKYLSAVSTRVRWRDAGMQGEPSVTVVREGELTLCR